MKNRKPELILPAGSMDTLKAAVLNGADAVYFGAKKFNARIPAGNFSEKEMRDAIDFCHLNKKKAYLALNILINDSEMSEAIETAKTAYCLGIDAVIVQDLGLIKALRELLPELELHGSTQLTCHNSAGAEFLKGLGLKKIVLARELSLAEIREIRKNSSAEIEIFVHGALCFSYSGQCLFSSFVFKKSGNRGMCLQPCRLPYVLREKGGKGKSSGFVLSMKDLMTVYSIKQLVGAGIDSFKVEGRLKGVGYVAAVAKAYRKAIDSCFGEGTRPSEDDVKLMRIAFMREPTEGYALGESKLVYREASARKGVLAAKVLGFSGAMIKIKLHENLFRWDRFSDVRGDEVEEFSAVKIFKGDMEVNRAFSGEIVTVQTGEKPFLREGQELYFTSSKRLRDFAYSSVKRPVATEYDLHIFAQAGKPLLAEAEFENKKAKISHDFVPKESTKITATGKMLEEKLFKSDDFFRPGEFSCRIEGTPFIPLSVLKPFKNRIMHEMRETLFSENRKIVGEKFGKMKEALLSAKESMAPENSVQKIAVFLDLEEPAGESGRNADVIVVTDSAGGKGLAGLEMQFQGKEIMVNSGNIQMDLELREFDKKFINPGAKIVCSNLGALQLAIRKKAHFWAGRELNIFNSLAARLLIDLGAEKIVPSVELSLKQLNEFAHRDRLVPLVFFYPVLMTSRAYAKEKMQKEYEMEDRKGFRYRVLFDRGGIMRIFNPLPVDMLFELESFSGFGMVGLDFTAATKEVAAQALEFLSAKRQGKKALKKFAKFTRGHYPAEIP
ncbi:MAG: U32 family peptidase [Candidatus Diapherotrites archaeon]